VDQNLVRFQRGKQPTPTSATYTNDVIAVLLWSPISLVWHRMKLSTRPSIVSQITVGYGTPTRSRISLSHRQRLTSGAR
jgi:hypothetical protein